jgi:hypothetical protein
MIRDREFPEVVLTGSFSFVNRRTTGLIPALVLSSHGAALIGFRGVA